MADEEKLEIAEENDGNDGGDEGETGDANEATEVVESNAGGDAPIEEDEKELEEMKNKLAKIEEESKKVREMLEQVDDQLANASVDKEEQDSRSIFVGNVDYSTKPKELQEHFQACGAIRKVTILCDRWTGHPKGFAYIEFTDKDAVAHAMELNESIFKGRPLKLHHK